MASKNFTGYLRDPLGEYAEFDKWIFTHITTTGETVAGCTSILNIGADGFYNIDIEYGQVNIRTKDTLNKNSINQGTYVINSETLVTTLPALLNAEVPVSDPVILEMEALLADAEDAADRAEAAASEVESTYPHATSASDFFALAEKRIRDNAGSGFAEWGNHASSNPLFGLENINQGLWVWSAESTFANTLRLGRYNAGDGKGVSRSDAPISNINGVHQLIKWVGQSANENVISLPPAPDGTRTYDSSTGTVVQHPDSATAFAAETATNKVITSRQDYAFIESWHELVSDKDEVYYLGCVQSSLVNPYGITSYTRDDGYTRFGEWDSTTTGQAVTWSTLTDAEKLTFLQDPENNLYVEDGELIQVRYRVRVVEGLGDDWDNTSVLSGHDTNILNYDNLSRVRVKGSLTSSIDITNAIDCFANDELQPVTTLGNGLWGARDNSSNATRAYKGLCFAIPIALVQRRNTGAYNLSYNPSGCDVATDSIASTEDCFNPTKKAGNGSVASGISGHPDGLFFDAIYSDDVEDLRMSSRRVPLSEIHDAAREGAEKGNLRRMPNDVDVLGEALFKSVVVRATNNPGDDELIMALTGTGATGSDPQQNLTITKTVDGVVSHTPESIAADVLYTTQLESENGVAKLVFNVDDSGVIDGTKAQSFKTQYFIDESN